MENRDLVFTTIARSDKWLRNHLGRWKRNLVSTAIARSTIGFAITSVASAKSLSHSRWKRPDVEKMPATMTLVMKTSEMKKTRTIL
ncbi:hypothetical protein TIFTF001_024819 [Ficus carica]|uniref:Uncharacterized protein n=1 Tax=Ficus carica TaxID=3494 RepID=A0AA88ANY4_FICCA|nr:hypothetical protein TIFTF001_024819 [Ficus carica]